jgi:hypothetical protein
LNQRADDHDEGEVRQMARISSSMITPWCHSLPFFIIIDDAYSLRVSSRC